MTAITSDAAPRGGRQSRLGQLARNPSIACGAAVLVLLILVALLAPVLGTRDPTAISAFDRAKLPSGAFWFGTDMLGRDLYSRVLYGTRVSLIVGFSVAIGSTILGVLIGVFAGFLPRFDAFVMRVMDGLMAIPSILLAIALIALNRASIWNVILAVTIAETPRVVRLIRGVVLFLREEPYVEAARSCGASVPGSSSATSCPTPSRRSQSKRPISARSRSWRKRRSPSSVPACRRRPRPGATSWPKVARSGRSSPTSSSSRRCSCRSPCLPSTCSATACAMPSTRACASGCETRTPPRGAKLGTPHSPWTTRPAVRHRRGAFYADGCGGLVL